MLNRYVEGDVRVCWILYGSICGGSTWMLGIYNPRFLIMRNAAATVLLGSRLLWYFYAVFGS